MSDNEERRVKARHEVTHTYQCRPIKKVMSRREQPRADMTIEDNPSPTREEESSEGDDVEDDSYMPSPRAPIHGRGKGLASGNSSGSGQQGIKKLRRKLQKMMTLMVIMVRRRKKFFKWRKSILPTMCIWGLQSSSSP
jgi:hypothetical protein